MSENRRFMRRISCHSDIVLVPYYWYQMLCKFVRSWKILHKLRVNRKCTMLAVRKSGGGPGIICHVNDVEGRDKVERT